MNTELLNSPLTPNAREPSKQMKSVLMILRADPDLLAKVRPFFDLESETIFWDKIWKLSHRPDHKAALVFAYGLWTDELRAKSNPFELGFLMEPRMRRMCLKAIALRWGLLEM